MPISFFSGENHTYCVALFTFAYIPHSKVLGVELFQKLVTGTFYIIVFFAYFSLFHHSVLPPSRYHDT